MRLWCFTSLFQKQCNIHSSADLENNLNKFGEKTNFNIPLSEKLNSVSHLISWKHSSDDNVNSTSVPGKKRVPCAS